MHSPAFAPQTPGAFQASGSIQHPSYGNAPFALTSPVIPPTQMKDDHEATAALLMLNVDRRKWSDGEGGGEYDRRASLCQTGSIRGMSVRDLLQ
jgi:hypothetical protein